MKVMIVSATDLPIPAYKGGATETLITELLNKINPNDNLFIHVYSNCAKKEEYFEGNNFIKYKYVPKTLFDKFYTFLFRVLRIFFLKRINIPSAFASRLCRKVDLSSYDVVILEGDKGQVNIFRRHFKGKIVLHVHTVMTFTKNTPFAKKILSNCDYVLANSHYTKKVISQIDGSQSNKIIVFQNCINTDFFKLPENNLKREEIRNLYNISSDDLVYIYCGRLEPGKGIRELIMAFKKCHNKSKLLVVGAGWFSCNKKTPYINDLITLTEDIQDKIIFTGYIEHSEITSYYYAADVCIVPSIYEEAAGLVVLEAQACGVPIIASRIGGIPEFAFEKSSVLIEPSKDFVDRLSEKMQSDLSKNVIALYSEEFLEFIKSKNMDSYYMNFLDIMNYIKDEKYDKRQ